MHESFWAGPRRHTRSHRLLAAAFWLLQVGTATAQAPKDVRRASPSFMPARLNADPNEAAYGFEFRRSVRGRFSDAFDFVGDDHTPGYRLMLLPLFELAEPQGSDNVLPSQYWRARISLEQGYGFSHEHLYTYVGFALTHESDHETAHPYAEPGFLALNDLDLRVSVAARYPDWAVSAGLDAILYVLSCTEPSRQLCEDFRGDTTFGGQAQLSAAYTGLRAHHLSPFASASASFIAANGLVEAEGRLSTRAGIAFDLSESTLALFLLGWAGNDVSILRGHRLRAVGAGASFTR